MALGLLSWPAHAQMISGMYTGNGTDNRAIIGLGFQPDVVIIKGADQEVAVCRTATMAGDASKSMDGEKELDTNLVQSLDADGFTIGSDDEVNKIGRDFHWVAFVAADGALAVGSYAGNDAIDNRSIDISDTSSSLDFQPDYVMVMSAGEHNPVHRSSAQAGDTSLYFNAATPAANRVQSLEANGFQVGTASEVNASGTTYHYVAWRAVTGQMAVGSYAGNGSDDVDITGVGFAPHYVIVRSDGDKEAVHHTRSLGLATDETLWFVDNANLTKDGIQSLRPGTCSNCFQVGKEDTVNKNSLNYFWMAFREPDFPVSGNIALDSTSNATGTASSLIWAHEVAANPNRMLIVGVSIRNASNTVTGITYGAQSLMFLGAQNNHDDSVRMEMWYVIAPASGTSDITVTLSGSAKVVSGAASFSGVHQTVPFGTFASIGSTGSGSITPSVSVTSAFGEVIIDTLATQGDADSLSEDAGQVSRWNRAQGTSGGDIRGGGSIEAGAGSVTMSWTLGSATKWAIGAVAMKPAVTPTLVELRSFTAIYDASGVLLRWRTGLDVNNLGWHIYRESNGERVQLTTDMIAGSALMFGPGLQLNAGNSYRWWDPAGRDTDRYWIEDRDLNGQRTLHGPVTPVMAEHTLPKKRNSALLSRVGRAQPSPAQSRVMMTTQRQGPRRDRVLRQGIISSKTPQPWELPNLSRTSVQYALAAAPALQLFIREPGIYRITQSDLVRAGLDPSIDPRQLQLFVGGQQQAIRVLGEADGRFDPQDAIEFYGTGLNTPWTDTQIYWLVAGSQRGQRIPITRTSGLGTAPSSFPFMVERKDRALYLATVKNGETENFFGAVIAKDAVEHIISLHHLDPTPSAEARLDVILQGVTTDPHSVAIQLNGIEIGRMDFTGPMREIGTFALPQADIREGENRVTLEPLGDEADVSVVENIQLTYWHTYMADRDALNFTAPGPSEVTIDGFSQPTIRVVDITDPHVIRELTGKVVTHETGSSITVRADGEHQRTLFAFTDAQVKSPTAIMANTPSTWSRDTQGADLVMISHGAFLGSIAPLKALRESQGWHVAQVDVEDVYDEFNFGHKSPWALRNFLHHASVAWPTPPRFVLLVGDASFDSLPRARRRGLCSHIIVGNRVLGDRVR